MPFATGGGLGGEAARKTSGYSVGGGAGAVSWGGAVMGLHEILGGRKEGEQMKAITIKQPWATLIALGEKKFETRSWQTKYRGKIAIHAGKTVDKVALNEVAIMAALSRNGIKSHTVLPTGAVIATVDLVECHKITNDYMSMYEEEKAGTETGLLIEGNEWWFGDYSEDRYAWELTNLHVLSNPIPAKGKLNLWEWEDVN